MLMIYVFAVLAAAGVWHAGRVQSDRISAEQSRFERASVSNCQAQATIVAEFNGYLQAQVQLIRNRQDLTSAVRNAEISNYLSHLVQVPDCSRLVTR